MRTLEQEEREELEPDTLRSWVSLLWISHRQHGRTRIWICVRPRCPCLSVAKSTCYLPFEFIERRTSLRGPVRSGLTDEPRCLSIAAMPETPTSSAPVSHVWTVLRWIAVLPAAVAGGVLAGMLSNIINQLSLSWAGLNPEWLLSQLYTDAVANGMLGAA